MLFVINTSSFCPNFDHSKEKGARISESRPVCWKCASLGWQPGTNNPRGRGQIGIQWKNWQAVYSGWSASTFSPSYFIMPWSAYSTHIWYIDNELMPTLLIIGSGIPSSTDRGLDYPTGGVETRPVGVFGSAFGTISVTKKDGRCGDQCQLDSSKAAFWAGRNQLGRANTSSSHIWCRCFRPHSSRKNRQTWSRTRE